MDTHAGRVPTRYPNYPNGRHLLVSGVATLLVAAWLAGPTTTDRPALAPFQSSALGNDVPEIVVTESRAQPVVVTIEPPAELAHEVSVSAPFVWDS